MADVFRGTSPTFEELFSAPYTFVDDALAMHYGLEERPGSELTRVALRAPRAGGLLTQGAFTSGRQRISRRGVVITKNVLCRVIPDLPPDFDFLDDEPDEGTLRQRWESVVTDVPSCQGCHELIDTFAFGLLNYDDEGRYQAMEGGEVVDASFDGLCIGDRDVPPQGEGPSAIVEWIATSHEAHICYGRQWKSYVATTDWDACAESTHELGDSIPELLQRHFDADELHPRNPGRHSVAGPYLFRAPDPESSVLSSVENVAERVLAYAAATDVGSDSDSMEEFLSALQELASRLRTAGPPPSP